MSTSTVITIDHVRAVGLCVNGTRTWFARHDLDFRTFLRDGCDAETLLATGDAMAQRVVEHARNRSTTPEQN
ncbi:hypothetical protein [Hydrogenophaga laconesensis]|uniref:Cell wall assembly regulator SMI1 n=1 Tax=Hydrogenophaga laconesensis TaxID=1805971 RepID=A0ABU1VEH1_9BURK|nr:hypothetical protein [Hydrogenophaga laconesensis]MDR7095866.1 cell wall assembly regulator SMI1 [Hydrogenophaga laconesensis]